MEFKKQTNAIYYCDYHLVITTKYRKKIINEGLFAYFKTKLEEIRKKKNQPQKQDNLFGLNREVKEHPQFDLLGRRYIGWNLKKV